MNTTVADDRVSLASATAHEAVDALATADLHRWSSDELLDTWRELERLRNRLASVEHRFIAHAEAIGLPHVFGARSTSAFVRGLLRTDPYDASARVRAAEAAAARTTLTGEPTAPPFVHLAAAQARGTISPRHASVVVKAVERLSDELQAIHGERVERDLVELAEQFDPQELGVLGTRITTLLDQDGALDDVTRRSRNRDLTVHRRPDGSARITGEATAELAERLLTALDALAAPAPAVDGIADSRSAGQRRHDALLDVLDLVARAELLPDAGGVATTVLLISTAEAWTSCDGVATTGHGSVVPVREAVRIAGGDARVMQIGLDAQGGVAGWTDARRLFTESQRLAMTVRDGGCSFPGCDAPPAWCQAAHLVDHARGGPTTVDNGTLLCGHHHRSYEQQGWRVELIDGRPGWIPPPWIDPQRRPRRNTRRHRPAATTGTPRCPEATLSP